MNPTTIALIPEAPDAIRDRAFTGMRTFRCRCCGDAKRVTQHRTLPAAPGIGQRYPVSRMCVSCWDLVRVYGIDRVIAMCRDAEQRRANAIDETREAMRAEAV